MARFLALICVLYLAFSCGQIGTISGGPKDDIAPQITSSNLEDKQLNFQEQGVNITFDEYIELNKPNEQIVLVPADAKLSSKLSKKTLAISFENSLAPNTTYTLYLNGAVKDVTEGNDSLMKFTFSTGKQMDSLRFHCSVFDAYSKVLLPKVTVGLYAQWGDPKPRYFAQSNTDGLVSFEALKSGDYYIKSFVDVNQDGQIQGSEKQGYRFESLHLDTAYHDTLKMAISLPKQADKVKNARVIPPGIIGIHIPAEMQRNPIKLNDQDLGINQLIGIGEDSLLISIGEVKEIDLQLIIESDTIQVRNTPRQQAAKITIQHIEKEGLQDRLFFTATDFIQWIDTSKITLRNGDDSSFVAFEVDYLANQFEIRPKKYVRNMKLTLVEGAITGRTTNKNTSFQKEVTWKQDRDFGDLIVQLSDTIHAGIIQVIQKNQVIRCVPFTLTNKLNIRNLLPGEYTFKIILDQNKNEKWDPISPQTKTLAEEVLLFNDSVKIRANWEIESTFEVSSNNE